MDGWMDGWMDGEVEEGRWLPHVSFLLASVEKKEMIPPPRSCRVMTLNSTSARTRALLCVFRMQIFQGRACLLLVTRSGHRLLTRIEEKKLL